MENKLKITGGKCKGRIISTPGGNTHPMGERERIALFNILGDKYQGAMVLDAFSGSGVLGIEALSRGAEYAIFIDNNPKAARVANKNLEDLGFVGGPDFNTVLGNVADVMEFMIPQYDIIFVDPPYDKGLTEAEIEVIDFVASESDDATLVVSHAEDTPPVFTHLNLKSTHKYARAHLSFYHK